MNKFEEYEKQKQIIAQTATSQAEYERLIKELAERIGL